MLGTGIEIADPLYTIQHFCCDCDDILDCQHFELLVYADGMAMFTKYWIDEDGDDIDPYLVNL